MAKKNEKVEATIEEQPVVVAQEENTGEEVTVEEKPKKRGRKPKSNDIDKETMDYIFEKRRYNPAAKEERREIYKSDYVIPLEKDGIVETDETEKRKEYNILQNAAAPGRPIILKGYITSMTHSENGQYIMAEAMLKDSSGYFVIRIPAEELFMFNFDRLRTPEGKEDMRRSIEARIGAPIEFIPMYVDEKEAIAYGSCVRAMAYRTMQNYQIEQSDGFPRFRAGEKAQAVVVEVKRGHLKVNVGGVEATILPDELDYNQLNNLTEEFSVGDIFNVKILECKIEEKELANGDKFNMAEIVVSKRQAYKSPVDKFFNQFSEGGIYLGEVKSNVGGIHVLLNNKLDCECKRPNFGRDEGAIPRGKKVVVKLRIKDEENKKLLGEIMRIVG